MKFAKNKTKQKTDKKIHCLIVNSSTEGNWTKRAVPHLRGYNSDKKEKQDMFIFSKNIQDINAHLHFK